MEYQILKTKLISLFEYKKLDGVLGTEWGFTNEISKEIKKIGYATNLTPDIIKEATELGVDLLITHHDAWEFIYGMKEVCQLLLQENNLIHAFFHAPLDDAEFGTSASLAKALKLTNTYKVNVYEEIYEVGVIGEIKEPLSFEQFSIDLSNILGEPIKTFKNNDDLIRKVCIVTGGGNLTPDIKIAVDHGCDTYITGEYSLYSQQYSRFTGINLLIGSHTNTEILGVQQLTHRLIEGTNIEAIKLSEENY